MLTELTIISIVGKPQLITLRLISTFKWWVEINRRVTDDGLILI